MPIELLKIPHDASAMFKERPNRFVGVVDVFEPNTLPDQLVHIHDPGRLVDLLYPGNRVLLKKAASMQRKTAWDLVAAFHNHEFVLTHSGFHRAITEKLLGHSDILPFGPLVTIEPEVRYGHSRLDFRLTIDDGSFVWVEVKGCTMAENNIALFPDAPTTRGVKHLTTLIDIRDHKLQAAIIILVFRSEASAFAPHAGIDPVFAETFQKAVDAGVRVIPIKCGFQNGSIVYHEIVPVTDFRA
ncbi:DNA/RNA nuclease SfsA [candidate division KSB1 bacterium]|nr:DNA/RNA nuclease SfsA [candidate division KSB1 bacterium]